MNNHDNSSSDKFHTSRSRAPSTFENSSENTAKGFLDGLAQEIEAAIQNLTNTFNSDSNDESAGTHINRSNNAKSIEEDIPAAMAAFPRIKSTRENRRNMKQ